MRLDHQVPCRDPSDLGGGEADAVGVEGEGVRSWPPLPAWTTSARRSRPGSTTIFGPQGEAAGSSQPRRVENDHPGMMPLRGGCPGDRGCRGGPPAGTHRTYRQGHLIAPTTMWEIGSHSVGNGSESARLVPGGGSFVGSPHRPTTPNRPTDRDRLTDPPSPTTDARTNRGLHSVSMGQSSRIPTDARRCSPRVQTPGSRRG